MTVRMAEYLSQISSDTWSVVIYSLISIGSVIVGMITAYAKVCRDRKKTKIYRDAQIKRLSHKLEKISLKLRNIGK